MHAWYVKQNQVLFFILKKESVLLKKLFRSDFTCWALGTPFFVYLGTLWSFKLSANYNVCFIVKHLGCLQSRRAKFFLISAYYFPHTCTHLKIFLFLPNCKFYLWLVCVFTTKHFFKIGFFPFKETIFFKICDKEVLRDLKSICDFTYGALPSKVPPFLANKMRWEMFSNRSA